MNIIIENKSKTLNEIDIKKCLKILSKEILKFDFNFEEHVGKDLFVNINNDAQKYSITLEFDDNSLKLYLNMTSENYNNFEV